jgi:sugE
MFGSLFFLSLVMKEIPVGMAYAIWTGIGAIGTLVGGMILYKEPVTYLRIMFILFIVIGIVGIHLTAGL